MSTVRDLMSVPDLWNCSSIESGCRRKIVLRHELQDFAHEAPIFEIRIDVRVEDVILYVDKVHCSIVEAIRLLTDIRIRIGSNRSPS
jgi:hypothetical protein